MKVTHALIGFLLAGVVSSVLLLPSNPAGALSNAIGSEVTWSVEVPATGAAVELQARDSDGGSILRHDSFICDNAHASTVVYRGGSAVSSSTGVPYGASANAGAIISGDSRRTWVAGAVDAGVTLKCSFGIR